MGERMQWDNIWHPSIEASVTLDLNANDEPQPTRCPHYVSAVRFGGTLIHHKADAHLRALGTSRLAVTSLAPYCPYLVYSLQKLDITNCFRYFALHPSGLKTIRQLFDSHDTLWAPH